MRIKQDIEYGLEGQFKVDIYNRAGEMVDTTEYFTNFITQTGLNYPLYYNFADCFRYLTLGRNGGANTMSVTGLLPDPTYVTSLVKNYDTDHISYQDWAYLGDSHLDKKSSSSAGSCGTIVGADGPSFYRGWKLPTGDNVFTEGQTTISEFMVSPSTGIDETGRYAFSRVPRSVSIPSGTRTIVTYMLNVKIKHTGVNYFHSGTFNTGQAEISEQENLVQSFGGLSGYYRQCYHGLRCVDNQGRTFIPKYGDPMEPSNVRLDDLAIYFSPDNSQFDVNAHGGGQSDVAKSYSADGLCALSFNHDFAANANVGDDEIHNNAKMSLSSLPTDTSSPFEHHKNIRLNATASERPPRLSDYTTSTNQTVDLNSSVYNYLELGTKGADAVSMATFGEQMIRGAEYDRGFKTAFSSMMSNLGVNLTDFTGRRRNLVRKAFITPINALGHNSRFGSLIYAFKNGSAYWPAVDCMFFDSSGRSVMQHYRVFSGCHLTERGKGIIKSVLTTDPPTHGGFTVESVQGPIVYDGNFGTSDITGHSGFYEGTTTWNENTYSWDSTPADAVRISGEITAGSTVPGDTGAFGKVTVGGKNYYGVGAIQGHLNPTAFDYGVVDNRVEIKAKVGPNGGAYDNYDADNPDKFQTVRSAINTPPLTAGTDGKGYNFSSDDLYWPNVMDGKLNFKVDDLQYYHVGLGIVPDPEDHFKSSEQIVADVTYSTSLETFVTDPLAPINYLPLKSITQNHLNSTQHVGFFLSRDSGWLEVDRHGNTEGPWSTSTTYAKGAIVDDGTGICNDTNRLTKTLCEDNGLCNGGNCSDYQHTTEANCIADGTCSDTQYTTKATCEANSETWSATNTWTVYTTETTCEGAGTCSTPQYTTKSACEGVSATWTPWTWTDNTWFAPDTIGAGAKMYRSVVDDNEKSVPILYSNKWEQISTIPYDGTRLNNSHSAGGSPEGTPASVEQRDNFKDLNNQAITGYLVPSAHMYNGDIVNTTWVGDTTTANAFPPANSIQVPVENKTPSSQDAYIGPTVSAFTTKVGMPNQMFDGFGSFATQATNMVARRSGDGINALGGSSMALIFTGCDATAGANKKSEPIYVLAGHAKDQNGDFDWAVNAQFTGAVEMTDFIPPKGYFIHYESPRLLPNFATGQAGSDSYPRTDIAQGGYYPGMSNLNTLEVYMDVSWSAPCAGVVGCVEQEA